MPEWMTHIIIGYLIAEGLRVDKKSLVLLGALIPDLITKFIMVFRYFIPLPTLSPLIVFHIPIGSLLLAVAISPLFREKNATYLLSVGVLSHLLLDTTLKFSGVMYLWPLSWKSYALNIFWTESAYPLMISLILLSVYLIAVRRR